MKPQDIAFLTIFGVILIWRKPQLFLFAGLIFLTLSIPLFGFWVFFTAERLVWYGAAFLAMFVLAECIKLKGESV
jgi:hypothetical protein